MKQVKHTWGMSNAQVLPFLRAQNQTRRPNGNSAMRTNDGMVAIQALQAIQGQEQSQRAFTSRLEDSLFLSHLRSGSSVLYLFLYSSTIRGMPKKTLTLAMTASKSATMKLLLEGMFLCHHLRHRLGNPDLFVSPDSHLQQRGPNITSRTFHTNIGAPTA